MECNEFSSSVWIGLISEAFSVSEDDSELNFSEALASKIGISRQTAGALAEGIDILGQYVLSDVAESQDAVDLEEEAFHVSHQVVRALFEAKGQQRLDELDNQTLGQTICPRCEKRDESQGKRSRKCTSSLGDLNLKCRYRYCEICGCGRSPSSNLLGLWNRFTPRMEEMCTMVATTVPYKMAEKLIKKLTGVEVSETALQNMVERRGEAVLERESELSNKYAPFQENGLPAQEQKYPEEAPDEGPDTVYIELDGVFPLTREEVDDYTESEREIQKKAEENKVPGGKGRRYEIEGKEVKNAILYDGKDCATETPGRGCLLDKSYVSYLGNWCPFALMVWVMMLRLGFDRAKRVVILSDGAKWIRSFAEWLPISVFLILDLYHVKKRIWEVANILYGAKTPEAAKWANTQCQRVEQGHAQKVIEALRFIEPQLEENSQKKKFVEDLKTYLQNNLDRMDYPTYREMGLRIGSGAVESTNFHVTGSRLKMQGMRWSEQGARIMALLRAELFNENWESTTKELLGRRAA